MCRIESTFSYYFFLHNSSLTTHVMINFTVSDEPKLEFRFKFELICIELELIPPVKLT